MKAVERSVAGPEDWEMCGLIMVFTRLKAGEDVDKCRSFLSKEFPDGNYTEVEKTRIYCKEIFSLVAA